MGVIGLWSFLHQKGYEPVVRHQSTHLFSPLDHSPTLRVDILGCLFLTIRNAYSSHPLDIAHSIVEKEIKLLGTPKSLVLYLDGSPSVEKRDTQIRREKDRAKAMELAQMSINELRDRVKKNLRVRKQLFRAIYKNLKKAFYWSLDARQAFAKYMKQKGWTIIECSTEADLAIAKDSIPGDIVISKDSDMLAYEKICTIWRPISRSRYLVYDIPSVLATLGLNRVQLTVLGVVSRNDYNRNIPSLGSTINFGIIKDLKDLDGIDAEAMVKKYLSHERVVHKNMKGETFEASIRVFVHGIQTSIQSGTPIPTEIATPSETLVQSELPTQSPEQLPVTHEVLWGELDLLQKQYYENRRVLQESREAEKRASTGYKVQRHKSSQTFNRYRTVDRPAPQDAEVAHSVLPQSKTPPYRPRYSIKHRSRIIEHEAPEAMKQYAWKPWKKAPESPICCDTNASETSEKTISQSKPKPKPKSKPNSEPSRPRKQVEHMTKVELLNAMAWEHPIVTLKVGTVKANVTDALDNNEPLALRVTKHLQRIVQEATDIKRSCQHLIGRYIERLSTPGVFQESLDREPLDKLCPRIPSTVKTSDEDEKDDEKEEELRTMREALGKETDYSHFVEMLMRQLHSGKPVLGNSPNAQAMRRFIKRLENLELLERNTKESELPGSALLRSAASQLTVELDKIYRKGSMALYEKLKRLKDKGLLPSDCKIDVDGKISAIENFIHLNKISKNKRKIAPVMPMRRPMLLFTEHQLAILFSKDDFLMNLMQGWRDDITDRPILQSDITDWVATNPPGSFITKLLSPVGRPITERHGPRGYKDSTSMMSFEDMKSHLTPIQQDGFDPRSYTERGYVLRSAIQTDGFRLHLPVFKLKELNSVRYRRLPPSVLPFRITSTTAGLDYYLTEIRNIVKTQEDVTSIWGCEPDQIKILGLDLGQACVLGASALLPPKGITRSEVRKIVRRNLNGGGEDIDLGKSRNTLISTRPPVAFHNLAVKQKAVYQPTFKYRCWLEDKKRNDKQGDAAESISDIESNLPPLHGEGASFETYFKEFNKVKKRLDDFYNCSKSLVKRHQWDAEKARESEYSIITNRLLKLVGGTIGEKRIDENKVVIAIGLGQFAARSRLSSLHGSFESYFVSKARSLGYVVVGVNEYYTSKKCPKCEEFVGQVEIRRLYCRNCKSYMHRDIMAAHNICNVVRGHLFHQRRPPYLQPRDENGGLPWEAQSETGNTSTSIVSGNSSSSSSSSSMAITTENQRG
ncbi:hypothetical protein BGX20_003309, partial [Mortierella sp. AD010]